MFFSPVIRYLLIQKSKSALRDVGLSGECAVARVPTHTTHPAQEGMCTCATPAVLEIPHVACRPHPYARPPCGHLSPMLHGASTHRRGALVHPVCRCHPLPACATHILGGHARCIQGPPKPTSEVLGASQDRQSRGAQEAWQYYEELRWCMTRLSVVWFVDGTVTGMTTSNHAVGNIGFFCSSQRAINPVGSDAPTLRRGGARLRVGR